MILVFSEIEFFLILFYIHFQLNSKYVSVAKGKSGVRPTIKSSTKSSNENNKKSNDANGIRRYGSYNIPSIWSYDSIQSQQQIQGKTIFF